MKNEACMNHSTWWKSADSDLHRPVHKLPEGRWNCPIMGEVTPQASKDSSFLKQVKKLEKYRKNGKTRKIYRFSISPHDFVVDLFEARPLNAKPFEAALAHSSSPEIIDLIWWTLMDDLAFRIPGQGLTSGRAVRKKPVPIHPRKGLYGSLVSLDGDSRMPLSFHHFGLMNAYVMMSIPQLLPT